MALIFARWAIATFANICIESQDGAGHRLVPRDESVKRGGKLVCFATDPIPGRPPASLLSRFSPDRKVSFFPNNIKAQAELRCSHAEETDSAPPTINDFGQEEDYLLLH